MLALSRPSPLSPHHHHQHDIHQRPSPLQRRSTGGPPSARAALSQSTTRQARRSAFLSSVARRSDDSTFQRREAQLSQLDRAEAARQRMEWERAVLQSAPKGLDEEEELGEEEEEEIREREWREAMDVSALVEGMEKKADGNRSDEEFGGGDEDMEGWFEEVVKLEGGKGEEKVQQEDRMDEGN